MNLVVLCDGIPSVKYPMEGIFGFDQAKALSERGINVSFIACDMRSIRWMRQFGFHNGEKDGIQFKIANIPLGRVPQFLRYQLGWLAIRKMYIEYVKEHGKPDIIHAHFPEMAYLGARLAESYNRHLVITEHSSLMHRKIIPTKFVSKIKYAYNVADEVIAVSNSLANSIKNHTGVTPIVIPNIIRTDVFLKCKKKIHDGFVIVSASNLIKLKRIDCLLRVMKSVVCKDGNVYLKIIGDGVERSALEQYVKDNNLCDNVKFYGQISRDQMAKEYESCDCFILPSSSETFGVAYVEALAAGLPVIATNCGGPRDFVSNDNGILVDVDNEVQLERAILTMKKKHHAYNVNLLRNFVVNKYSPEIISGQLIEIYNNIINK